MSNSFTVAVFNRLHKVLPVSGSIDVNEAILHFTQAIIGELQTAKPAGYISSKMLEDMNSKPVTGRAKPSYIIAYPIPIGDYVQPMFAYPLDAKNANPLTVQLRNMEQSYNEMRGAFEQVMTETAKELGCASDNEEILNKIRQLKVDLDVATRNIEHLHEVNRRDSQESDI